MVDPSQLPQSLQHLMAHVQPLIERYGYWGLGICIFVEGIGIPAPGQSLLIISAALAAQGQMNIAIVLAVAGVSTWLGGQMGYWIGLYAGRPLLLKLPISNSHLTRIHRFFQSWGGAGHSYWAFYRWPAPTRSHGRWYHPHESATLLSYQPVWCPTVDRYLGHRCVRIEP